MSLYAHMCKPGRVPLEEMDHVLEPSYKELYKLKKQQHQHLELD